MRPDWRKYGTANNTNTPLTREKALAKLAAELMADIETLRTSLPRTRTVALALAIIVEISEEDRDFYMPNWLWEEAARRGYFAKGGI
jgi:hypothetical protein